MADGNSKPTDPRYPLRAALAQTDLRVEYHKYMHSTFIGTRSQLEAENVTDLSGKWPCRGSTTWEADGLIFSLRPEYISNLKKLYGRIPDEPRYRLMIDGEGRSYGGLARYQVRQKLDEIHAIQQGFSANNLVELRRWFEARKDTQFKRHLDSIVNPTKPRQPKLKSEVVAP